MTVDLILVGCGEHGSVVADAVRSRDGQWRLVGYTDRAPNEIALARASVLFLGTDQAYLETYEGGGVRFVLGLAAVGVSPARAKLARMYEEKGAIFAAVVHATAWISPSAQIDDGAVLLAGAIVNSGAHVGRHAIVNTGAIVEHDVVVGAFASISPGAVLGGGARIGEGSFIGLGARVRDHVSVGPRTLVGMGAVVVGDVDGDRVVLGVPARVVSSRSAG